MKTKEMFKKNNNVSTYNLGVLMYRNIQKKAHYQSNKYMYVTGSGLSC